MFNWLNIELSNRCNKECSFCGRASARKKGELELGDIDLCLFQEIMWQYKDGIIQFNKDGDALLYDDLDEIGYLTHGLISNIVTNGILLYEKRKEIINNFTSVTVSVIEEDDEQYETVKKFVEYKGDSKPEVLIKFLGNYHDPRYEQLGLQTLKRSVHAPKGDFGYKQSEPPIPEIGVCLDFLNKPSVSWNGKMYICNRYDPEGKGIIGDLNESTIEDIWNGEKRTQWLQHHKDGRRDLIPLCKTCTFWGIPAA